MKYQVKFQDGVGRRVIAQAPREDMRSRLATLKDEGATAVLAGGTWHRLGPKGTEECLDALLGVDGGERRAHEKRARQQQAAATAKTKAQTPAKAKGTKKACTKCREDLPAAAFFADRRSPTGLTSWCRGCLATRVRERRAAARAAAAPPAGPDDLAHAFAAILRHPVVQAHMSRRVVARAAKKEVG